MNQMDRSGHGSSQQTRLMYGWWMFIIAALILTALPKAAYARTEKGESTQAYQTVNFQVNYRSASNTGACDAGDLQTWSSEAQAAMNHVIDILDDLINSTIPIVIDACYQNVDPNGETLAFAGENGSVTQDEVPTLPVANRTYPMALANAISGADQNGAAVEIVATANSAVAWDFCTIGCTVDANRTDFVSTMVHEVLHGLGVSTSFDQREDDPTLGTRADPPTVSDDYVVQVSDGSKLLDLPNDSTALLNALQQGSGTIAFNGPNTVAINNGSAPFIFSPNPFQQGSSGSHWDDDHSSNLGRMMNAATGEGPSSRIVSAITLMFLKDIGWSVNEASDHGDGTLNAYGDARHINAASFVNYMTLGASFTSEAAPAASDASDDGIGRTGNWTVGAGGGQITAAVSSSQAAVRGCLSSWIDWSADGDFGDAGETLTAMQPVGVGNVTVQVNVPASASNNTTYNARFRLVPDWDNDGVCTDQVALTPAGGAVGGEVEDYQWRLTGGTTTIPPTNPGIFLPLIAR